MSEWLDRYRAYREQFNNAWLSPNEGREQNGPDESNELGEVVPHMEPPSVESLEQLSEWCGIVHSAHLLPDHLRQIQDSAETLGVRVKLTELPMESEFLDGRNQELMDRWKNIVTEFIESIKRSLEKLCTDDPILDNEVEPEANLPSLTLVEQAIIEICDRRQLINEEIISELAVDGLIIETRSMKTTVQRLIELGLLHRPDGVNSRKGVTKKT